MPSFDIYGVTIAAPFPVLGGRPVVGREPDIAVEVAEVRPFEPGDPRGTQLLDAVFDGARSYALGRDGNTCHLRVNGFGDFELDQVTGALRCSLDPATDPGLLDVLLCGMVPALWLYLHDEVVLHAATVTFQDVTLAIVGRSGMGKSTLAALLCGEGATLVGDDVLCVRFKDRKALWRGRSPELRLRPQAVQVADAYLPLAPRRATADERLAVTPPATSHDSGPLGMVVVPLPTRDGTGLSVRRLPPVEALTILAGFPRLSGWSDPSVVRRQFDGLAGIVNAVAVLEVRLPWGPPFLPGLLDTLWPALFQAAGSPAARSVAPGR